MGSLQKRPNRVDLVIDTFQELLIYENLEQIIKKYQNL